MRPATHGYPERPEEADGFRLLARLLGAVGAIGAALARAAQRPLVGRDAFRVLGGGGRSSSIFLLGCRLKTK